MFRHHRLVGQGKRPGQDAGNGQAYSTQAWLLARHAGKGHQDRPGTCLTDGGRDGGVIRLQREFIVIPPFQDPADESANMLLERIKGNRVPVWLLIAE